MNKMKALFVGLIFALCFLTAGQKAFAYDGPTDEITKYEITVDVNEDATLNIRYHIEWKVLESDEAGPLSWVKIGIPNKHVLKSEAYSDNIRKLSVDTSDGCYAKVYFKDDYYEGQTVSFDFMLVQDNMYQVDKPQEGMVKYVFTPGWFDEIAVKELVVRWNHDKADSWSPDSFMENGYLLWGTRLSAGERFSVDVVYPNDAYAFHLDKEYDDGSNSDSTVEVFMILFVVIFALVMVVTVIFSSVREYGKSANLGAAYETKITRTKIVYYPVCEGCGGVRAEGKDCCASCGRDMIQSKEIIEEKKVKPEDREALWYKKNGTYHYSSDPHTYVRVNTIRVPSSRPRTTSSARSSCAHSSCACACACACAGGGRAGCSTKDFYRTSLRLKQLKRLGWEKHSAERKS